METEISKNSEQAETIANQIKKEMGEGFFTLAKMRTKIFKIEGKHSVKLTWDEAQKYVDYLTNNGFCEVYNPEIIPTTTQYRIRVDIEFRKKFYGIIKQHLEHRISEINISLGLLDTEHLKQSNK